MANNRDVWVFIEQEEGKSPRSAWNCWRRGKSWRRPLGGQVCGLLCGYEVGDLAETVIHHGADRVLLADHPELEIYRTLPYARVATDLVRERKPYIFLFGASPIGRDLAPRVASAVRAGLTADCTDLQIGDYVSKKDKQVYKDLLYQIRPAFGGNLIATIVNPDDAPADGDRARRRDAPPRAGRARARASSKRSPRRLTRATWR